MPDTKNKMSFPRALEPIAQLLRDLALGYPETKEEMPWGHSAFKVRGKSFLFMGSDTRGLGLSVKLPHSRYEALALPFCRPTEYGLGKHGWVSASFGPDDVPPLDLLAAWVDESFRAIAPAELVARRPPMTAPTPAMKTPGTPVPLADLLPFEVPAAPGPASRTAPRTSPQEPVTRKAKPKPASRKKPARKAAKQPARKKAAPAKKRAAGKAKHGTRKKTVTKKTVRKKAAVKKAPARKKIVRKAAARKGTARKKAAAARSPRRTK